GCLSALLFGLSQGFFFPGMVVSAQVPQETFAVFRPKDAVPFVRDAPILAYHLSLKNIWGLSRVVRGTGLCDIVQTIMIERNHPSIKNLPDRPGVYFFKKGRNILYVGKATSLADRVRSYFLNDLIHTRGARLVKMMEEANT